MNDSKNREALLRLARDYVNGHQQKFDLTDPGRFWGDALCDVLGGADYLTFQRILTGGGVVIVAVPVFGEPVKPEQFTIEQLATVVAAGEEIYGAAAPTSSDGLDMGTEAWILSHAALTGESPLELGEALFVTAYWLVNTPGGLLDLTRIKRPWHHAA